MQRYLKLNKFHSFLDDTILKIKEDNAHLGLHSGFISYLDENKISEKFSMISSIGRFKKDDNLNIISAKEIDILSIVYISKQKLFKNNVFINILQKDDIDLFFYFEFEENILESQKENILKYFIDIDIEIFEKQWELK